MAHAFIGLRRNDQAEHVAQLAADALEPRAEARNAKPEELSLYLRRNAPRPGHRHRPRRQPRGRSRARRGADRNDYNTGFGPTNVELHAVSAAVDLGDAGEAIDLASTIDAGRLSPERQVRFLIDVARAHTQRRHIGEVERSPRSGADLRRNAPQPRQGPRNDPRPRPTCRQATAGRTRWVEQPRCRQSIGDIRRRQWCARGKAEGPGSGASSCIHQGCPRRPGPARPGQRAAVAEPLGLGAGLVGVGLGGAVVCPAGAGSAVRGLTASPSSSAHPAVAVARRTASAAAAAGWRLTPPILPCRVSAGGCAAPRPSPSARGRRNRRARWRASARARRCRGPGTPAAARRGRGGPARRGCAAAPRRPT